MFEKPLALIIEDDEKLADIFTTIFGVAGYETKIIYDGAMAKKTLSAEKPTVIVLDLHLPQVSGVEILEEIKTTMPPDQTQVVIITADVPLARKLQDKGEVNVLIKPVHFNELHSLALQLGGAAL